MYRYFTIFLFIFTVLHGHAQTKYIQIPDGIYDVGSSKSLDNPSRKIKIKDFQIAEAEVTNTDFQDFVSATGYVTLAEKYHNAQVFEPGLKEFRWLQDSTAYWRFPNGTSRGGIEDKMSHPVTCISFHDVMAYCAWAGVRLPTFEEWEVAAKAGSLSDYSEGISLQNIQEYANIWHKKDHLTADTTDSYIWTSPVKSFKPNAWGLYDIFGNVFEFCEGSLMKDKGRKVAHARGGS